MHPVGLRPATFRDAQAIDALVAALPPLRRDLDGWVNQADLEIAAVDGTTVVGFAARKSHREHPTRDLATVHIEPGVGEEVRGALYDAVRGKRPLKVRIPREDDESLDAAGAAGFVARIRSATYEVPARDLIGPSTAVEVDYVPGDVFDAFAALYANTHAWDPPQAFSRRYVRRMMLAGARHIVVIRGDDGPVVGVGAAHASDDDTAAADIALAGAVDPTRPDAEAITRMVLGKLASYYQDDRRPLWFEVDHGVGTNTPLARRIDETLATAHDEVLILTND